MGVNFLLRTLRWETCIKFSSFSKELFDLTIFSLSVSQVTLGILACGFENKQPNLIIRGA